MLVLIKPDTFSKDNICLRSFFWRTATVQNTERTEVVNKSFLFVEFIITT